MTYLADSSNKTKESYAVFLCNNKPFIITTQNSNKIMYTTILVACISAIAAIGIYMAVTNLVTKNSIRKRREAALKEAEAHKGPSLVIAYAPCINHGIAKSMKVSQAEQKLAVECGYWPLFRYSPELAAEGKNPFQLDSPAPDSGKMMDYLKGENRYASLQINFPDRAQRLYEKTVQDAKDRYAKYRKMAED